MYISIKKKKTFTNGLCLRATYLKYSQSLVGHVDNIKADVMEGLIKNKKKMYAQKAENVQNMADRFSVWVIKLHMHTLHNKPLRSEY